MRNRPVSAMRLSVVPLSAAIAAFFCAPAAFAQQQDVLVPVDNSHPVVQPLPPKGTAELDAALKRLAIDSSDVSALVQAGNASLKLNDIDAAVGFFTRAQVLGSDSGEAKAGLAAADVYRKMPVEALKLFDEAQAEGVSLASHASDHGLAYDLVGENVRAQELYRLALKQGPNDETIRRLALSQAIGGDQVGSERTLLPLLQHRDLAAYRTRAFALAALGKTDEAVSIAEAIMPASLASRIAPYLRYMPKLTRAQQAAAANFGHFPKAGAIGRDDPRIAEYAAAARPPARARTSSDDRLVPAGAPLGAAQKPVSASAVGTVEVADVPPVQPTPANSPPSSAFGGSVDSFAGTPPTPSPVARKALPVSAAAQPTAKEAPRPALSVAAAGKGGTEAVQGGSEFDLGDVSDSKTGPIELAQVAGGGGAKSQPQPAETQPKETQSAPSGQQPSLDKAFAEFEKVKTTAEPAPGAVDVTEIKPAREAAKKPEPPKNPSRIWVQVATGTNRKALGFDWRRITRKAAKEFKGKDGYLVDWNRTNRLVTGPFSSEKEAQAFVDKIRAAGLRTFIFTSKQGEEVTPLSRR